MSPPDLRDRVDALLHAVGASPRVLVVTHDNPDPDSIASALALGTLLSQRAGATVTLAHGGVLGRAENRTMVRLLKIPLVPFSRIHLDDYDVVALVDTQPGHGNHRLVGVATSGRQRLLCIDHHPARDTSVCAFADVGGDYGATSTKLTAYLHAAGIEVDRGVASALFYGIKSDTRDLGREVGDVDIWAYTWLISRTDMTAVSAIEHPRLPRGYYAVLARAVRRTRCFDDVLACDLGPVYVPDLVAETADWLLSGDGVRWTLVVGEFGDDIYASIRVADRRFSAGRLVRDAIAAFPTGSAGGHGSMAGARVPLDPGLKKSARARRRAAVMQALLRAAGVPADARPDAFATPADEAAATMLPRRVDRSAA